MTEFSENSATRAGAPGRARDESSYTEARRGDGRVHETIALYRLLVESVRDYAIFALDAAGHILTWNPGAQRFKGWTAEEAIGRHFSMFYPEEDQAKPAMELEVATREGRFEEEGWRVRKDGSRFWASVTITALRDESGTLVGFAKVTRDMTERRAAQERALADARRIAEMEAADRARSQFLTSLSHELRTPLNAIGGYLDLLLLGIRGPLTKDQQADLDRIRHSQRHLLALINDLLNVSRIAAGRLEYRIADIDVSEVFDSVAPMIEPLALSRDLAFHAEPPDQPLIVRADRLKFEQIVINLLSNAVKFTPAGGRVGLRSRAGDAGVTIEVEDTGVGIPADELDSIFTPFVQLGRSLTSIQEGAGLGLAISRELARGMDGDLTAESEPGKGSIFRLTLPAG